MKKIYVIYLLLFVIGIGCKQNTTATNGTDSAKTAKEDTGFSSKILYDTAQPAAAAPFTIKLVEVNNVNTPALQSFVFGQANGLWLMTGGRTNGFHGTSDNESTFPTKYSNTNIFVYDPVANKQYKMAIPDANKLQLQSTNMNYYQDGDYLYCIGGYGSNCATDSPDCYQTFPNLTAINVPNAITAIKGNDAAALAAAINTIEDSRMQVTGGALRKIGDWFYLTVGQNYNTVYKGGVTGIYTDQIRKFQLTTTNGVPAISNYIAYDSPWPATDDEFSQFHRRDLTVAEAILVDGSVGINIFGGVFTKHGGAFTYPISIAQRGNLSAFILNKGISQKFNLYECAYVPMFDPVNGVMYTVLLGGISDYYYDKKGNLMPGNPLNALPFSNHVTTIVRTATNAMVEYPQQTPALPGYIGSDAEFIVNPSLVTYRDNHEIIDFSKLTTTGDVLLGAMYGGITATAQQSSEFNPTFASNKIYQVYLTR
jgi:predicted small secreted protein